MVSRQDEANRTLYVGNLDYNVKEEILYELFLQAGPLTKVTIAKDKEGNCKSFGFVCFQHTESVPYAIALLNGIRLFGRPIKLQYRTGSVHSSPDSDVLQGPDNGFAWTPPDYGMPVMGGSYGSAPPPPPMNNGLVSQAYFYFQGMMNQFLSLQTPEYSLTPPVQHGGGAFVPWNRHPPLPSYSEPWANGGLGPSSTSWDSEKAQDCRVNEAGPQTRKRAAVDSDSDSSDSSLKEYKMSKRQRKLKAKRRKTLGYFSK